MNTLSDNSLMLRVKAGESHTLGLLYERYKKRLFGFFYQMNKNASLSEDLVQNVFIRILKYKHTYTEESNFISWLFQIARNENYDYFKKQKKHNHDNFETVSHALNGGDSFERNIELSERKINLEKAISKLPSEKKELIILSKIKELKYKEIAEITGCTEGNARIKVHRALHDLREIYLTLEKR